jgi:hypothetical protein
MSIGLLLFHVTFKSRDLKMGTRSFFVLFVVLSCPEVKQSRNYYPIPFHVSEVPGGAFLPLTKRALLSFHITLSLRLGERPPHYAPIFASLAVVAILDGKLRRLSVSQIVFVCSCCLVQNWIVFFVESAAWSESSTPFAIGFFFLYLMAIALPNNVPFGWLVWNSPLHSTPNPLR